MACRGNIHGLGGEAGASPKLKAPVANVIANEIHCNLHQPGVQAAVPPEALARLIRAQKTILSDGFGRIQVAQRSQREAEHLGPVHPHQRFELPGKIGNVRTDRCLQFGRCRQLHGYVAPVSEIRAKPARRPGPPRTTGTAGTARPAQRPSVLYLDLLIGRQNGIERAGRSGLGQHFLSGQGANLRRLGADGGGVVALDGGLKRACARSACWSGAWPARSARW